MVCRFCATDITELYSIVVPGSTVQLNTTILTRYAKSVAETGGLNIHLLPLPWISVFCRRAYNIIRENAATCIALLQYLLYSHSISAVKASLIIGLLLLLCTLTIIMNQTSRRGQDSIKIGINVAFIHYVSKIGVNVVFYP